MIIPCVYLLAEHNSFLCVGQYKLEEESGLSAKEIISRHVLQALQQPVSIGGSSDARAEAGRKFCLFFDESRGVECDVSDLHHFHNCCSHFGLQYLEYHHSHINMQHARADPCF